jgi:mRNA interferase RelE/StbE
MKYQIIFTASAEREIRKLPADVQDEVFEKVQNLGDNPRPHGYKRLTNFK